MDETTPLPERISEILESQGESGALLQQVLTEIAGYFQARTCTFHRALTVSYTHLTLPTNREV